MQTRSKKVLRLRTAILDSGKNKVFLYLLKKRYSSLCVKCSAFIPLSAKLGQNICFPHGINGIYISSRSIIGDNCTIFQQVTIGSNTLRNSKNQGSPNVGKNVYIGAGAKIIGGIKIGDNVRIGANAVVFKDVPDNSTVVMDNMKIISHSYQLDNEFVSIGSYGITNN